MRLAVSFLTILFLAPVLPAENKDLATYPLRIHIFRRAETTFYHGRVTEEAKGEGRANLFENGEPKGLDFEFDCSEKLKTSSGFETFPAKWKKPNQELLVLMPEFGKPGTYSSCKFKVQMKNFTYFNRNGMLANEPTAAYKEWMTNHDYDPEHGKDTPTGLVPQPKPTETK
jgi:hypothetical protein